MKLIAVVVLFISPIHASYPPVNVEELHPLSLSWNQVHYLVRENLWEMDELRKEHENLQREIRSCFGLERCLKEFNLLDQPDVFVGHGLNDGDLGAGALIASLKRDREEMEGSRRRMEAEMREEERHKQWQQRNRQVGGSEERRTYDRRYEYSYRQSSTSDKRHESHDNVLRRNRGY